MILRTAFPLFVNCPFAGRAKTPDSTPCFAQFSLFLQPGVEHLGDHQLGDALAALNRK
jgi:hypothetical protein